MIWKALMASGELRTLTRDLVVDLLGLRLMPEPKVA